MNKEEFSSFLKEAFFISLKDDSFLIAWEISKNNSVHQTPSLYLSDFFLSQNQIISFKKWKIFSFYSFKKMVLDFNVHLTSKMTNLNRSPLENPLIKKRTWILSEKKEFFKKVSKIKKLIAEKSLTKALPIAYETSQGILNEAEKCYFLLSLLEKPKHGGILYGFWNENEGLLGKTPEFLFDWNLKRNVLFSMALAGTASIHSKNSLLNDPKELKEHAIVVKDLQNKLKRLGTVWKSKTFEWPYGVLKHLRTDFFIKMKESLNSKENSNSHQINPFKIIKLLHPTPALGIFSETLKKFQKTQLEKKINPIRKYFGAPFCVSLPQEKRFFCLVAIRNLQWFNQKTYLMSGCGLISESHPDKEWKELELKRESVKALFKFNEL